MGTAFYSLFTSSTSMTITLASLASSLVGVGRQSTLITNITAGVGSQAVRIYWKITTGTTPTVNNAILIYLLQGDAASPNITTDNAGASDAAITIVTAANIGSIQVTATSNVTYYGSAIVRLPGPRWGVAVVNASGSALNATGSNHDIRYVYEDITT